MLFQITFKDRKLNNQHDTHLSVDCTDCRIQQKGPTFASYKFKGKSALRYEVALGILSGEIKWLNGPYPCKDWPDINIFRDGLMKELELGERVEADDGYVGESPYVTKVPSAVLTRSSEEADAMQKRVQGRHENVNAASRVFGSLIKFTTMMQHNMDMFFAQLLFLCSCPLKMVILFLV